MDSRVVKADFAFSIFVVVIGFSVVIGGRISSVCQVKPCWKIVLIRGVHSLVVRLKCLFEMPKLAFGDSMC